MEPNTRFLSYGAICTEVANLAARVLHFGQSEQVIGGLKVAGRVTPKRRTLWTVDGARVTFVDVPTHIERNQR